MPALWWLNKHCMYLICNRFFWVYEGQICTETLPISSPWYGQIILENGSHTRHHFQNMWWDLSKFHMALSELSVLLLLSDVHVIPAVILSRRARMARWSVTDMPAGDWSSNRHQQSDSTCLTSKIIYLHTDWNFQSKEYICQLLFKSYGTQWYEAKVLLNSFNGSRKYMILFVCVYHHSPVWNVNALELHLSCTNSSIYSFMSFVWHENYCAPSQSVELAFVCDRVIIGSDNAYLSTRHYLTFMSTGPSEIYFSEICIKIQ